MAKRAAPAVSLDFAFFTYLHVFYKQNRGRIQQNYRHPTRRFLEYNDPERNPRAFLRQPQFEALEIYIFLKEYLDNAPVHTIFRDWYARSGRFAGRDRVLAQSGQMSLLDELTREQYDAAFSQMRHFKRAYPNYIFALTMGVGKTILMATCIFYEFLLANAFPKDEKYCHNALIFAPDLTVLQALREIESFDWEKVMPPMYTAWLHAHVRMHYLDDAGMTLDIIDNSSFNIIVSNTQKIILKRQHKAPTAAETLFAATKPVFEEGSVYAAIQDLYEWEPDDETGLTTNQRFQKLQRIRQLGIYVDEAHHAFGRNLARDVGATEDTRTTSLRNTIDLLAASLKATGTRVVACYNFTGTPYDGDLIFPDVVYAYGLKDAIDRGYLKKVAINGYTNPRSAEFVRLVIDDFLAHHNLDDRHEHLRPKLAFFAATIKELQHELRPAVEQALARHNIPPDRILVNVGDPKLTTDDDIRLFNALDTPDSTKQIILLVGKGREGWNCRSLFGVALFRKPDSRIFVLQATMRCLRAIGSPLNTGRIYLSQENLAILDDELKQNFRVAREELETAGKTGVAVQVRVKTPPTTITLRRVRRMYQVRPKQLTPGASLHLEEAPTDKYRLLLQTRDKLTAQSHTTTQDISHLREQQEYTRLTLVAEIARYLNKSPLFVEDLLDQTAEGADAIVAAVNQFNELLYDWIIPHLFREISDIQEYEKQEEYTVELVKMPEDGFYTVTAQPDKIIRESDAGAFAPKSFHLDTYVFDSNPEQVLFWSLVREGRIQKLYFTGMLTHGQTDFYIQYIDPDTHTIRSYYPDFLFQKDDGTWVIVEVKGDNKIDDPVVQAKRNFAEQMATASGMTYHMIKGSDANAGHYSFLLDKAPTTRAQQPRLGA